MVRSRHGDCQTGPVGIANQTTLLRKMAQPIVEQRIEQIYTDTSADELGEEYSYKSVSRAAVLSATFALMGLLAWVSPLLLFLPALGLIFGLVAVRNLKRYPAELTGRPVAGLGIGFSAFILAGASAHHIYVYNTEVPEGFERVPFALLKSQTGAPDFPPPSAILLNGKKVFLKGYIHPTSISSNNSKTFVLVPDWATCCFGTQPPLTHMIEVRLVNDQFASKSVRQHSIAGTLEVHPYIKPIEGLQGVYYQLNAEHFQ